LTLLAGKSAVFADLQKKLLRTFGWRFNPCNKSVNSGNICMPTSFAETA